MNDTKRGWGFGWLLAVAVMAIVLGTWAIPEAVRWHQTFGNVRVQGFLNVQEALQIKGTSITATAAELNYLDVAAIGVSENSKAAVFGATGKFTISAGDTLNTGSGVFQVGNTHVTATGAELNYLDVTAIGVSENSKAAVFGATGKFTISAGDTLNTGSGVFQVGNTHVTATGAELNYLDVTAIGVSENSKAAVFGATGKFTISAGDTIAIASGGAFTALHGATVSFQGGATFINETPSFQSGIQVAGGVETMGAHWDAGKVAHGTVISVTDVATGLARNLTNAVVQLSVNVPEDSVYVLTNRVVDDTTIVWGAHSIISSLAVEPDTVAYLVGSWY